MLKPSSPRLVKKSYEFKEESLKAVIEKLAGDSGLNVVFDISVEQAIGAATTSRTMENVTSPDALEFVLHRYGLTCARVDTRTIVVSKTRKWPESEMSVTSVVLAAEVKEAEQRANANKATSDSSKFDVVYRGESLYSAVMMLGKKTGLKTLFEPTIEDPAKQTSIWIDLSQVTIPGALTFILDLYNLKYDQVSYDTIIIVEPHHQYSSMPLGDIIKSLDRN